MADNKYSLQERDSRTVVKKDRPNVTPTPVRPIKKDIDVNSRLANVDPNRLTNEIAAQTTGGANTGATPGNPEIGDFGVSGPIQPPTHLRGDYWVDGNLNIPPAGVRTPGGNEVNRPPPNRTPPPPGTPGSTGGTPGEVTQEKELTPEELKAQRQQETRERLDSISKDPKSYIESMDLSQEYTDLEISEDEIQDPTQNQLGDMGDMEAQTIDVPEDIESTEARAASIKASLIDPNSLTKAVEEIDKLEPMKAASMSEKLNGLLDGMEEGNVPLWARPAVAKVEQMLASRGISASSVGRDSLFNAIIQSAMPIAQQDATFEQDSYRTNYQAKVNAIMSDVNMEFAAKQFNANSKNQVAQFNAQLQTQVSMQNAARADAMKQFSVDMEMRGEQFNATQVNSMVQLQTQLENQRDQFNANMATQIEQSNINWRRQVNSANTAGINAVNQANVQNAFNLSNQALTFMWQEMRDEAHWDFQATQADKDRKAQLEASLLANETAMGGEIGKTLENIVSGSRFLGSFLDNWS